MQLFPSGPSLALRAVTSRPPAVSSQSPSPPVPAALPQRPTLQAQPGPTPPTAFVREAVCTRGLSRCREGWTMAWSPRTLHTHMLRSEGMF